eukprot:2612867-Pleurochrysis_carterae.AAC.1
MLTDSRTARTTSPRSSRRCASAAAWERACRWRCEVHSPSADCGVTRLLERRRAASAIARAERGILCATCPSSPCPGWP